jgi:hypothetical protein
LGGRAANIRDRREITLAGQSELRAGLGQTILSRQVRLNPPMHLGRQSSPWPLTVLRRAMGMPPPMAGAAASVGEFAGPDLDAADHLPAPSWSPSANRMAVDEESRGSSRSGLMPCFSSLPACWLPRQCGDDAVPGACV